ncbi:hypothetical protein L1987_11331 [Smallanthus sonchifolius]|uniref:Uncharacterized protein n=1 Tax=Smallanthus sonchifolius TaxID=185202 RepID=A0ACB9JBK8_9ASTR|nr:hypothetical protein L1987_11331 [Smallanthus sonchifolius]
MNQLGELDELEVDCQGLDGQDSVVVLNNVDNGATEVNAEAGEVSVQGTSVLNQIDSVDSTHNHIAVSCNKGCGTSKRLRGPVVEG